MKVWLPGLQTFTTVGGPEGLENLDWREVARLERLAEKKAQRLPKCLVCEQALMCGQTGSHHSCR